MVAICKTDCKVNVSWLPGRDDSKDTLPLRQQIFNVGQGIETHVLTVYTDENGIKHVDFVHDGAIWHTTSEHFGYKMDECDKQPYPEKLTKNDVLKRLDFNGRLLLVGETILCIVGRHFKRGKISAIDHGDDYSSNAIHIEGIKTAIPSHKCIKQ